MKLDRKIIPERNPIKDTMFLFSTVTLVAFGIYQAVPTAETMAFFWSMAGATAAVAALNLGQHINKNERPNS